MKNGFIKTVLWALFVIVTLPASSAPPEISDKLKNLLDGGIKDGSMKPPVSKSFQQKLKALADEGEAQAQYYYGMTLTYQSDWKEYRKEAKGYLTSAMNAGCVAAMGGLAAVLNGEQKYEEAIDMTLRGAESGDTMSQIAISGHYARGDRQLEQSLSTSYAWDLLAQRQNHSLFFEPAIVEGLEEKKAKMTEEELQLALAHFETLSKEVPVAKYYFCGQSLMDASKNASINPLR